MRCLLPAFACVLLVSGGCGLELTKEEGERRSADSGLGGITSGNLLDSPAPKAPPESQPPAETQPPAEEKPAEQAAETGKAPPNTTAAADQVTVGAKSTDSNVSSSVANRKLVKKG